MEYTDDIAQADRFLSPENLRGIGERIASERSRRGWSQRELARRVGISSSRLSRIERGHCVLRLIELVRLRCVLSLDADELVFGRPAGAPKGRLERLARAFEEVGDVAAIRVVERLIESLIHDPAPLNGLRISL